MKISIDYNKGSEQFENAHIGWVIADCASYSGMTVVICTNDFEEYWKQLILAAKILVPKIDKKDGLITFSTGSTIQIQLSVDHDNRSQCELENE